MPAADTAPPAGDAPQATDATAGARAAGVRATAGERVAAPVRAAAGPAALLGNGVARGQAWLARAKASWRRALGRERNGAETAAGEPSEQRNAGGEAWLARAKAWAGSLATDSAAADVAPIEPQAEDERIAALAVEWGTTPILGEDDLKYEGMQPLTERDKPLLDWITRNAGNHLCVRVKRSQAHVLAWIITDQPNSAEVEATMRLLTLRGWDVTVRPARRDLVARAVERDQGLSPTEVEEKFRELLGDAIADEASDIHFEIRGERAATRFRVNGEMREEKREDGQPRFTPSVVEQFGNYMFNRLAKRGARQFVTNMALNASAQMKVGDQTVALRFSTAPDIRGVDIFVRVWRPDQRSLTLDELGYKEHHIAMLTTAIRRPYGVIVFSGPTGSGKSSSLTAMLDGLDDDEKERRKIISLEEPVERELRHVTHVSVSGIVEHGGWKALLSGLNRWDSNINVLGEIKDADSADAIMDLATAGKLILTTLHAANVLSIPQRMEELGVDHQLLYDANFLVLLVSQRLVPRLCPGCRIPLVADERNGITELAVAGRLQARLAHELNGHPNAPAEELQRIEARFQSDLARYRRLFAGEATALRGLGCAECAPTATRSGRQRSAGTGVVGRVLLAEMVLLDDGSREFIRRRAWDEWRQALARTGWKPIVEHAVDRIRRGEVDPGEVERLVCPLDEDEAPRIDQAHGARG